MHVTGFRARSEALLRGALLVSLAGMRAALGQPASSDPAARAQAVEAQLTDDERFGLLHSLMVINFQTGKRDPRVPTEVPQIAGWVQGVKRLGVPDLLITDASLGITNPGGGRPGDTATALPAGLALASTFDPALARKAGVLLGVEARSRGFNVLCGGGMNLARDPRHGRNFEYLGEDPLLAATLTAESVLGTQSTGVTGMLKHVSLNSHETNKFVLDARIDPAAHRESELLAFQIALERSHPGALMCAYNKVNGDYACGNDPILNGAVKQAMGFPGFVMSDWKAVYGWEFALRGLDQQSGAQLDEKEWFIGPLREAYAAGKVPRERISDMVRRILWAIYSVGADRWDGRPAPDMAAHDALVLQLAREGTVLLKNDGVLPLNKSLRKVAVIGGNAHLGMMGGGGGSTQVIPPGGYALLLPLGGPGLLGTLRREVFVGPSPLQTLKSALPDATLEFDSGEYATSAAALAHRSDVAIVFATKFESEGFDSPDLALPGGQDAVIAAVARANPRTVVVLETGNPVLMPWLSQVKAVVEAWYSGQAGGRGITGVLTGEVNPSGRLPITWPRNIQQTPHPALAGFGTPMNTPTVLRYEEGAEVGYRGFAKRGEKPLFPFGHGLGYTRFAHRGLELQGGETVTARCTVTNVGKRAGADVVQLYLTEAPGEKRRRLLGFERVQLEPGESRTVSFTADPRLLARFDAAARNWRIAPGPYQIAVAESATDLTLTGTATLIGRSFGR